MDILTSGYGELEVESFVKFFVEEKVKFKLTLFIIPFFLKLCSVNMISTFYLKLIHENFIDLKSQYPDKSVRFQCF